MKIIEKIEIKYFRSFDGGKDQEKVHIKNLTDLNIFSGANDSGKSNVLRALNLFFNNEISTGVAFDIKRDFSKIAEYRFDEDIKKRKEDLISDQSNGPRKSLRKSDVAVSIKVHFNNSEGKRGLPGSFWVSKVFSSANNYAGVYNYQADLKGSAQVTLFLKSFQFEYIPAIKDRYFFTYLFSKLQNYLFEKEDKKKKNKFKESSDDFTKILKDETDGLFKKFLDSSGVDASFHIPSTLVDFFRTLSIKTENDISLFDRGDGVQARFIPEILDEISKNSTKNIIWGFEEPENSYESRNICKLRDEFVNKYSREKQIFITTHTKEFLSIKREFTDAENQIINNKKITTKTKRDEAYKKLKKNQVSSEISIYRVWKNKDTNDASFVTKFDEANNEWEKTCDDLGIVQESRIIEDLQSKLSIQIQKVLQSNVSSAQQKKIIKALNSDAQRLLGELENAENKIEEYEKPILYVEDTYDQIYKIAFLKIEGIDCTADDYDMLFKKHAFFTIRRGEGAGGVSGRLRVKNTDGYEEKKVIGLFDFDKEGRENFHHLSKEFFWEEQVSGAIKTGYSKRRTDHICFYSLLLPIPEHLTYLANLEWEDFVSYVEVENLLPVEFLEKNNFIEERNSPAGLYGKVKKDKKDKIWKNLFGLDSSEFIHFKPLYHKINELFNTEVSC